MMAVNSDGKESAHNAGDLGLISGSGRFPGEGNGNPLQYSCLENSVDRGAWRATVHGVTKSQTRLSNLHTHTNTQLGFVPYSLYQNKFYTSQMFKYKKLENIKSLKKRFKKNSLILRELSKQDTEPRKYINNYSIGLK